MNFKLYLFLLLLIALCCPVIIVSGQTSIKVEWYSDPTRNASLEQAQLFNYKPLENGLLKVGYSSDAEWLKITIQNPDGRAAKEILYLSKGSSDSVSFYYPDENQWRIQYAGTFIPDSLKTLEGPGICFPIHIDKNEETYYLRLVSSCSKQLNIRLIDNEEKAFILNQERFIDGFYIGAFLIITLYNIFLGFNIRDKLYYYYAAANIATLFAVLATKGTIDNVLPDVISKYTPAFLATIHIIWAIVTVNFSVRILGAKRYSKLAYYLLIGSSGFMVLNILIYIFLPVLHPPTVYVLLPIGALIYSICSIYSGFLAARKGSHYARYYLMGWAIFFGGIILLALSYSGIIEKNIFTSNAYWIASIIEVLLLSFALADRYRYLQKQKDKLEENLKHKEGDLSMVINDNRMRHQFRKNILGGIEEINQLQNGELRSKLSGFIMDLKLQIETEEKLNFVQDNISEINAEFDALLQKRFPALNASEREMCQLIKLNLSIKEIARIRKMSEGAVKAARHRIRKKMNLDSLEDFQKL